MQGKTPRETGEALFLDHLKEIEKAIRYVNNRAGLHGAEAEDFASIVKLRLIENDYAILRSFEGRATFPTFISIVINRFLLDHRIQQWGKWRPSAEATRLGAAAVLLEKILYRDGRTIEEAFPLCRNVAPGLTKERLEEMAARLPRRSGRPRTVDIQEVANDLRIAPDSILDAAQQHERELLSRHASAVVKNAVKALPEDDQLLLRLRFGGELTIAQISRTLEIEQKPLYRRLEYALRNLRKELEKNGITVARLEELLTGACNELDFGLQQESERPRPSNSNGPDDEPEDH